MKRIGYVILALSLAIVCGCSAQRVGTHVALPPEGAFPEGIAAGADTALYVGSLTQGTIVKVMPGSLEGVPFIPAPIGQRSVIGVTADPKNNILWACFANLGQPGQAKDAKPTITAYDLASGAVIQTFELKAQAFPNHIAVDRMGRAYVTDSFRPVIYRVDLKTNQAEEWLVDPRLAKLPPNPTTLVHRIGLNGIAFGSDNLLYAVKTNTGELYRITVNEEGQPEQLAEVALPHRLDRPDGLEALEDGSMIVVTEGSKVLRLTPDRNSFSMDTLQDGMDFPTTTATLGNSVWVVESQLQLMGTPEQARPFRLVKIKL